MSSLQEINHGNRETLLILIKIMKKGEHIFWKRIVRQSVMFLIMSSVFFVITIIDDIPYSEVTETFFIVRFISAILFILKGHLSLKFWQERKRWQFILFTILLVINTVFRLAATIYYCIHFSLLKLIGSVLPLIAFVSFSYSGHHFHYELCSVLKLYPQRKASQPINPFFRLQ